MSKEHTLREKFKLYCPNPEEFISKHLLLPSQFNKWLKGEKSSSHFSDVVGQWLDLNTDFILFVDGDACLADLKLLLQHDLEPVRIKQIILFFRRTSGVVVPDWLNQYNPIIERALTSSPSSVDQAICIAMHDKYREETVASVFALLSHKLFGYELIPQLAKYGRNLRLLLDTQSKEEVLNALAGRECFIKKHNLYSTLDFIKQLVQAEQSLTLTVLGWQLSLARERGEIPESKVSLAAIVERREVLDYLSCNLLQFQDALGQQCHNLVLRTEAVDEVLILVSWTRKGASYHYPGCKYWSKARGTPGQAESAGKQRCVLCCK